METIYIYTDGGSRGNPGPSGIGVYIETAQGDMIKEVSKFLGFGTNNVAEYQAVLVALQTLKKLFGEKTKKMQFEVRMDSELVQRQLTHVYKVKHPDLIPLFKEIESLAMHSFPAIAYVHVRREKNKDADRLANDAMDRGA